MNDIRLRLILDDVRSAHNVGAMLRTADATGVELVYACGLTPHPQVTQDSRPPHVIASNHRAIAKTALGAESTVQVLHKTQTIDAISEAKKLGFRTIVIEQAEDSLSLFDYVPPSRTAKIALVVGNEVTGVSRAIQAHADHILELPMLGRKESLNVASTAAIVLYQLKFGRLLP